MSRYKILVKGPALSMSGYGEQTRFALQCLRSREDLFDIFLFPLNWGKTGWISESNEEREWINHLVLKTHLHSENDGKYDMSLQVTIPNEWEKIAPINIGYTAGVETSMVSPQWIQKSFLMDRVITTSKHSRESYQGTVYTAKNSDTGEVHENFRTQVPMQEVNYSVRFVEKEKLDIDFPTNFNFLTVAQWGPRKNVESTLRWFVEEFHDDEGVGLVLKTNTMKNCIMDRIYCAERLKNELKNFPDKKCKVYLLHGDLSDGQMSSLYAHPKIKGLLSLTHGEGFGLPLFEAVCNGLPVIAPGWSGQLDFLHGKVKSKNGKVKSKPLYTKIEHRLDKVSPAAVWEGVIQPDSMWCYPEEKDCKLKLRKFYKNHSHAVGKANKLKSHVLREFAPEKKHEEFVNQVLMCAPETSSPMTEVVVFD